MTQWKPIEEFVPVEGSKCKVCHVLADLTPVECEEAERILADRTYTHKVVATWLSANGHKVTYRSIGRHRANECGWADR